uniref:Oxysterol-binding protein n=1 Tax=Nothobranchius furzeri TaxID=105023 RepID=A0A8C6L1V9_NOTFU
LSAEQPRRSKMTTSSPTHSDSSSSSRHGVKQDRWEIVEGLRGVPASMQEPDIQEGLLLKKRKWPMKGWHKRYFVLERGILNYAKRAADLQKGKPHGCIDVGLSVMSIKKKAMCIDLDTEDNIYHLKVKSAELFEEWVLKLRHHRMFRQNEIALYPHEKHLFHPHASSSPSLNDSFRNRATLTKQTSIHHAKVGSWLQSSEEMNKCSKELEECESYLLELNLLLKSMEVMHRTHSAPAITALQTSNFDIPKKEKRSKRWRSKHNGKEPKSTLQVPSCISNQSPRLHASNPNLSTAESATQDAFSMTTLFLCFSAVHISMKSAYSCLIVEKERLKQAIELHGPQLPQVIGLKSGYASVSRNSSLVHQASSESRASIPESMSEFFDAQEYLLSSSSSENEMIRLYVHIGFWLSHGLKCTCHPPVSSVVTMTRRRRSALPCPCPPSSVSLWNILRNNIGKDLSKVAMPVQLNEPLNTLQRLCEELEYSDLLDTANQTEDAYQRMVYVATFAISAYASSYYRAGSKPFNPVLGETYECDRPDKGFRFIAEQVSHHPPVSACHSDSKNFNFWQDMRWKNKFWGKSMEIVPMGTTHVTLPAFGDHYEWNKVTSCIHNILSGQRWIEHYGEISIKNINSDVCQCKVTFVKAKSWSSAVNEIEGVITDSNGKVIHSLFGKWHESVFQGEPPAATCIWRPGPVPENKDQYYGFTQFAVELNELDSSLRPLLPPTDTRFRPDQRLLEEGNVDAAEEQKQRIEQLQRERRKVLQDNNMTHQPRFFKKSKDDSWVSNKTYWELRREPGFSKMDFPVLW